ncbi:endonuclease/exonuclease/phosphatase family protein [Nocardioides ferulae]|uniref:endonuclease/exonuclease/phosphatase family protein n=1 Tax=Nocardioides ferulae TaxID=2340821 RepID=UPI000EB35190|nr:endonuclease/exonuclease/phosphatase family protein [Nocardioides ferulae]
MRRGTVALWVPLLALLAAALPVTAVRLLEPEAGPAVRLVAFTPVALPAYAVVLGVALPALLRRRGVRSPLIVLSLVAALGLGLHAWWFAPMVLGPNPPPSSEADPFVVVTANIYGGEGDVVELVRLVSSERADLLVVAEANSATVERMESAGLEQVLPHRTGAPADGLGGTVVFAREPVTGERQLDTRLGGWRVEVSGLTLLAVHPMAPTDEAAWRADHATIRAEASARGADLVVGDLNATLDHAVLRRLLDVGYRDAAELANAGWQPTWPANGLFEVLGVPLPTLAAIDHVLVGERLAVLGTRTVELAGTDHRVLVAELAAK